MKSNESTSPKPRPTTPSAPLNLAGGGGLDAITVTFMRFNGTRLDPTDACATQRIGGPGGGASLLNGDGTPIIGICGRVDDQRQWLGLGLIFLKPPATAISHD